MKKYKTKLKKDFAIALEAIINDMLIAPTPFYDDEKMFLAILYEIKEKLYIKLGEVKKEYGISFTNAQALAIRILFEREQAAFSEYVRNRMRQITNEIHQHYA